MLSKPLTRLNYPGTAAASRLGPSFIWRLTEPNTMPKNPSDLTAKRLRELLDYDLETGTFRRKVSLCNSVKVGDTAGDHDGQGYLRMKVEGRQYKAHRLAWLYVHGCWPAKELDHINGVRSDNRIVNLREATTAENGQNRTIPRNNTSNHHGVGWDKRSNKWRARIKFGGRDFSLGSFSKIEDAISARAKAKAEMHRFQPTERTGSRGEGGDA